LSQCKDFRTDEIWVNRGVLKPGQATQMAAIKLYASFDFNDISHDLHAFLDNLMLWSNMWQLNVNINKCNVLRIGKSCVLGDYSFSCDVLPRVEKVADLGNRYNS